MKIGVVFFHSNIHKIYKEDWIQKCISSIRSQTYKELNFYEIDYNGSDKQLLSDSNFFSIKKENYADAMNFIITEAFNDGCDYIFNTNLDDFYSENRIEKQIVELDKGYDIVTSEFCYVDEFDNITLYMNILKHGDIKENLDKDHNVIAHPCVGYNKTFWSDIENRYDISKTPQEDLVLWKKSINNGYKFKIMKDLLLYYRIHNNQVSTKK